MRERPDVEGMGSRPGAANFCMRKTWHFASGGLKIFICEMGSRIGRMGSQWAQFSKIHFSFKMILINKQTWDYDFSWYKMRRIHVNPLYLTRRSLIFVKIKGRMNENMMFENREVMSSSGKLSSRREMGIKTQLEGMWHRIGQIRPFFWGSQGSVSVLMKKH